MDVRILRPDVVNKLHELYSEYRPKADALGLEYINEMQNFISKPVLQTIDEVPKGVPGGDAQITESPVPSAAGTSPRAKGRALG